MKISAGRKSQIAEFGEPLSGPRVLASPVGGSVVKQSRSFAGLRMTIGRLGMTILY
jgi:hypothetical protein